MNLSVAARILVVLKKASIRYTRSAAIGSEISAKPARVVLYTRRLRRYDGYMCAASQHGLAVSNNDPKSGSRAEDDAGRSTPSHNHCSGPP